MNTHIERLNKLMKSYVIEGRWYNWAMIPTILLFYNMINPDSFNYLLMGFYNILGLYGIYEVDCKGETQ